jgi:hypothetical protein
LSPTEETALDAVVAVHDSIQERTDQVLPVSDANRLKVEIYKPTGKGLTILSHDFTDETTWYYDSYRVINDELVNPFGDGNLYRSDRKNWIDLLHGKVTREKDIVDDDTNFSNGPFLPIVRVNGVEKQEGVDYIVDYHNGEVCFQWPNPFVSDWYHNRNAPGRFLGMGPLSPSDVVTADYSAATTSNFYIKPNPGKVLRINKVECQFSLDIYIDTELSFEVWAYAPPQYGFPPGTKVPVPGEARRYRGAKDYINEGNEGTGYISQFGGGLRTPGATHRGVRHNIGIFPFDYISTLNLQSSLGLEIRIKLLHDRPYNGEYATVTLYCEEEDE